jgi:hypothetical protein
MTKAELESVASYLHAQITAFIRHAEKLSINGGSGWQDEYGKLAIATGKFPAPHAWLACRFLQR